MQDISASMKTSGAVEIQKRLEEISGGKVLDVGTEQGEFISTLMKTLKDYDSFIGIDISEEYLEKGKGKFSDEPVEFQVMNAENIEFDDDSFDTVCISHTLHHLENSKEVLNEVRRVLKPGGFLILQESFRDGDQSEAKKTDILVHHWHAKIDSLRGVPHFETLSQKEIRDLVWSMKFSNIEVFETTRYVKCLFCKNMKSVKIQKTKTLLILQSRKLMML